MSRATARLPRRNTVMLGSNGRTSDFGSERVECGLVETDNGALDLSSLVEQKQRWNRQRVAIARQLQSAIDLNWEHQGHLGGELAGGGLVFLAKPLTCS